VLGAIISALFIQFANYHWIFYFTALLAIPAALLCILVIPSQPDVPEEKRVSVAAKLKYLDLIGVSILTAALILFIFALTSGSDAGWSSAQVLAPLIISVLMIVSFFVWEAKIPIERASVPPQMWFLPNFAVLFGASLIPFFWWNTIITTFYQLWQEVFGCV